MIDFLKVKRLIFDRIDGSSADVILFDLYNTYQSLIDRKLTYIPHFYFLIIFRAYQLNFLILLQLPNGAKAFLAKGMATFN